MATKKKTKSGKKDAKYYESEHLQAFVKLRAERKAKKKKALDKEFVKEPAYTKENVQKFKRGFKWLAVLSLLAVSFAFGLARYNGLSFYGLMAIFIVTCNLCIYTEFLDERTEHWLNNPNDTTGGILLKIMAIGNASAAVIFTCVHTAQQIFPHVHEHNLEHKGEKPSQELVLQIWGILGGTSADVVTMVVFLGSACFAILHLLFLMAVVIDDTIRTRCAVLVAVLASVIALWVFDSQDKGLIHLGPKFMQAFLALNFVFAVPRNLSFDIRNFWEFNIWRKLTLCVLGPFILYRCVSDYMSEEPVINLQMRVIYAIVVFITFLYAPGGDGKAEEEEEPEVEVYTDYLIKLEPFSFVAKFAVRARQLLYMVLVEVPLNLIFADQKQYEQDGKGSLATHVAYVLFESFLFSAGVVLLLFRPEGMGPIDSFGALLDFMTRSNTLGIIRIGTVVMALWFLLSYAVSYYEQPLAPFLQGIMGGKALPMTMSMIFFVFFMFFCMLSASASFNAFACVVCTDEDDGWFIMLLKRQTFYATTSVCTFMMYAVFDLARDSFTNHLQEEADNLYMLIASFAGVTLCPDREPYEKILRPKLRSVIFVSMFLGLLSAFMHPSEGAPQAKFQRSADGLSINMFGMTLARDNINHEHVTEYQRAFNHSYSACTTRWGGELTAVDHAILARMAYFQPISSVEQLHNQCLAEHGKGSQQCGRNDPELIKADQKLHAKELADMQDALTFIFPEAEYGKVQMTTDWDKHSIRSVHLGEGKFSKYYRFDFPKQKHTVIAVQGTDPSDLRDVIVDMRLWFVSGLADTSEKLIFLMNFLPKRNRARLQWVIDVLQTTFTIDESRLDFYAPVVQYVNEVITTDETNGYTYITGDDPCPKGKDCWTVSVAGHSLGGGIASIVGSTLGVSSVSYSGPGFFFAKYQFSTKLGNRTVYPSLARAASLNTVFIPSSDAVPRFDSHIGAIQHTACTKRAPLSCHSISAMVCDLLLRCGDNQDQKRFHRCADGCFAPTLDVDVLENNVH